LWAEGVENGKSAGFKTPVFYHRCNSVAGTRRQKRYRLSWITMIRGWLYAISIRVLPQTVMIIRRRSHFAASQNLVAIGGIADIGSGWDWMPRWRMNPKH
jgi:hypothetical protein